MQVRKSLRLAAACAALLPLAAMVPTTAEAKGCLRGAAAGAVAGHMAHHHAIAGAMIGCAAVHHHYAKKAHAQAAQANHT
jgi:hypothetical protein